MARESRKGVTRYAGAAAGLLLAAAILASCAGAPRARPAAESLFIRLGAGASVYAVCEGASVRPIIEAAVPKLSGDSGFADLLARTDSAAFAVFDGPDERFRLVAVGDYPTFRMQFSMTFSRGWKKIDGPKPYWRSGSGLSVAFDTDGAVIVSDGSPWPSSGGPAIPSSFYLLRADAALRAWVVDPASSFSRALGPGGESIRLPVSQFAASLSRSGGGYGAELIATSPGEKEARALSAILRFAKNLLRGDDNDPLRKFAGKALRSDFTIDGASLVFKIDDLSAAEIAELLPKADDALLNR